MIKKVTKSKSRKSTFFSMLLYLGVAGFVIFSLFPILWMVSTSSKPASEIYTIPPQIVSTHPTINNYLRVLRDKEIVHYFINSLIIAGSSTILSVIIGILGAYGFSRFKFPGRNFLVLGILVTRMLPTVVFMIPFYILLVRIGLYDTHIGLILLYLVITLPLSVWFLKSFFEGVPEALEDAARIDGCSRLGALFRVVLPISFPAIFAVLFYAFIVAWNEFTIALVVTGKSSRTISVGLAYFQRRMIIDWGGLMSAATLMVLPMIVFVLVFEKRLLRGLGEGALKE